MRTMQLVLLLIIFEAFVAFSSPLIRNEALAQTGTGVGIRKNGPLEAVVSETIEYSITVYNLGDYWIRNMTATDKFPNGTSSTWNVPDLAPRGQVGDTFNISKILYTIKNESLPPGNSFYIINHAETTGYSIVEGLSLLVQAETNYPTLVFKPFVGGYSVRIKTTDLSTPTVAYITMLSIMTVALSVFRNNATHASVSADKMGKKRTAGKHRRFSSARFKR